MQSAHVIAVEGIQREDLGNFEPLLPVPEYTGPVREQIASPGFVAVPGLLLGLPRSPNPQADGVFDDRMADRVMEAPPRDLLGRVVYNLILTMVPGRSEDLSAPRVSGFVRQLRHRVMVALLCTVASVPVALWLLIRGVAIYIGTESDECNGPLRIWLLGFLMLQLAWPICMPSLTLLLLGWCLGAQLFLEKPLDCPQLPYFLWEALSLQTLQSVLLLTAAGAALKARPLVQRLSETLGHSGTDPEVMNLINTVLPAQVPPEEECVICLSREDEDGVPWRELVCGHRFHEPCLLEWLMKARQCPVCRLDLHHAYRHSWRDGAAEP